jgi:hypothetical protein
MPATELERHSLDNNYETLPGRSLQAHGSVDSATLVTRGRTARNAEDEHFEQKSHTRQSIPTAGIASDLTNARYRRSQADVVRAARNLSEWRKYLPDACIKAMVAGGWHFTV